MTKIKINCLNCNKELLRSPSKVEPRNYCSRECYSEVRNKEIVKRGIPYRIDKNFPKELREKAKKALREKITGDKHYSWKGENVSYRGLHYWLRRKLGKPTTCKYCGKFDERPRFIQWANADGKYRRDIFDYISLCVSCHKLHDLKLKRANQDC